MLSGIPTISSELSVDAASLLHGLYILMKTRKHSAALLYQIGHGLL